MRGSVFLPLPVSGLAFMMGSASSIRGFKLAMLPVTDASESIAPLTSP